MTRPLYFFALLFALIAASRMCHTGVLWEGDALPLAAAGQMLDGKTLYRDVWYDKPPLVPAFHLLSGSQPGWPLRLGDALYILLCCAAGYALAKELWSRREGLWAAGILAFYLTFYLPSAVIPSASDLLMLAPHLAAVWMAHRRRPFWSGVLAGIAFWASPKAVFVAAACVLWYPAGAPLLAAGFSAVVAAGAAVLWSAGALGAYWEQVWVWGRNYAADTFVADPLRNGVVRTLNWAGFHAAAVVAGLWFIVRRFREDKRDALRWLGWLALALAGVAAGMRFFPRYYFLLLAVLAPAAARGFTTMKRGRALVALLFLIPLVRFAPAYATVVRDAGWRDVRMDRDSRAAASLIRRAASPEDTLFVWGYRPELFVYTGLRAATPYLDSQPLTGVPADRHLTQSSPVEPEDTLRRRREALARTRPSFVVDGIGQYNPRLAIGQYEELREWFSGYVEAGRTSDTVVYRRIGPQ